MSNHERIELRVGREGTTRREFLAGAAALGAVSVGLASFEPRAARAQTPQKGGHLRVGLAGGSTTDSLDPATWTTVLTETAGQMMYNQLTEIDEHVRLLPCLAESWEAKPGATEWIFKLRPDVTFHNGRSLVAADVVHSINHHRAKDSKSPIKATLGTISDVKATDKHEVTITLSGANQDLPFVMANYLLCIGPEGTKFDDGMGTGAYVYESFAPGASYKLKRNPNHWRSDRGFVDSIEILAVNDPTARLNGLLGDSLDLINRVDARVAKMLEASSQANLYNISGGGHDTFPMRCDMQPFNDLNLRLAMKYAIDRDAIVAKVLGGYGKVGNDTPIPSFDPMFAADIPQRPYDPDMAAFYFAKSGISGPIILSVSDEAFSGAVDAAQIFQQSAGKAGIAIQIERAPAQGYWDDVWMKKPFCASGWQGKPTADLILSWIYKSDAAWNETFWKRPEFDKLLLSARAEGDGATRRQMYHDLQLMIYEDGGEIVPMFNNFLDAGAKKVKGFVPTPTYEFSGFRAPEKVWLAA
jgi:peptide/nickel transport system substrate-binding protein